MIPWELIAKVTVPGSSGEMRLLRRGEEFSIRLGVDELMNSRMFGSEEALADLAFARFAGKDPSRVLVGGLGMGYTLAAALRRLGNHSRVVVAELVPEVLEWNRGLLSGLAGEPLKDRRVTVRLEDVAKMIRDERDPFDIILLDVDNGPEGLTRRDNNWLYTVAGLESIARALKPGGILALWSIGENAAFTKRLRGVGFEASMHRVGARGKRGGGWRIVWIASSPVASSPGQTLSHHARV